MSAENGASGHVFISYVRENSSEVDDLQRILESHGIRVWRDKSSLWPGDDWQVAIRAAITDDALVFIACFSRESVAKRQSYQHEELNLAVEEMRRRPSGQPWLIPARLNECEIPDINLGGGRTLRSLHWADLFGADAGANADRLVSAVRRILGKHSTQAGLPEAVLHQPVSPPGAATPPQEAPPLAQHVPNGSASANWPVRKRVKRRSTLAAVCLIVFAAAVVLVVRTFFGGENAGPGGDWALTTLQGTGRLSSDSGASVAFSPAGTTLATDSGNDAAYLRNLSNLKIIAPLPDHGSHGVSSVAFSPGGTTLAVGDYNGTTYVWNTTTRRIIARLHDPGSYGVDSVAFGPGRNILAVGDNDGVAYVWYVTTQTRVARLYVSGAGGANSVAFSPNGADIAVGQDLGTVYVWKLATQKRIATVTVPGSGGTYGTHNVNSVAFGPGGTTLAIGDEDGSTYLWNRTTHKIIATLKDPRSAGVNSVEFGQRGTILAVGDQIGITYLWDVATRQIIATLREPGFGRASGVNSVAFDPSGSVLVAVDSHGTTYLWKS